MKALLIVFAAVAFGGALPSLEAVVVFVDAYFAYQIDQSCNVTVQPIANEPVPGSWVDWIGLEKTYGYVWTDEHRQQIRKIRVLLYRSDSETQQLDCEVDYSGNVLSATVSTLAARGKARLQERIEIDAKLPDLGTFTRAFIPGQAPISD